MDLLAAFRSFVRVAETGSFSTVSREFGTSQPTVSRHIALLEHHFGVRLFNRTTRSLTMTEDGRGLLIHAREIAEALEAAESEFGRRRAAPTGLVRLGAPTAFTLYLSGRIGTLLARHPALSVELVMRESFGDIVEEGLDLAVRVGPLAEGALIARRIGAIHRVLVVAPDYLAARPAPAAPHELATLPCVTYAYGSPDPIWQFEREGRALAVAVSGSFRANNSEAAHRAVLAGLGIGLLPAILVADSLATGRLCRLLPDWDSPGLPVHIVHAGPRRLPLRTRTVFNFLIEVSGALRSLEDALKP